MSIAKPFTFVANTYAKASEVNADFDVVYSQVNTNISDIAQNATDIDNLENNKANINGSTSQRFAVADAVSNGDAINKQTMVKSISNILPFISGYIITKDSGSPNDTIIVSEGSCYDSTHTTMLIKTLATTKQNTSQSANATYYVYVIGNSTGSSVDILISASSDNPGLPAGYSLYRQIGYYTTDANGNIDTIGYYGIDSDSNKVLGSMAPDYTAGISAYNGFIAPKDGVIVSQVTPVYTSFLVIDGVAVNGGLLQYSTNYSLRDEALIGKGSVVTYSGTVQSATFYPLKGAQ